MKSPEKIKSVPTLLQALLPIIVLVALLFSSVYFVWGDDSLSGASQMALIFSTAIAILIGWRLKYNWKEMLAGITNAIQSALPAILILLLIGALAGTWLLSGIVPAMIYYGLQILNPTIFLFSACIISAIVSLATGSSWSTIATVGVALLGIGQAMGISTGLIAGAVISGAYFGDKMSPMSDTTNLAPAVAGTNLFTHIRYMVYTTLPSISITLIIFLIIGFFVGEGNSTSQVQAIMNAIDNSFYISPVLFLVPIIVILLIVKKVEAIPALFIGVLLGGIFAVIFQSNIVKEKGAKNDIEVTGTNIDQLHYIWLDSEGNGLSDGPKLKNVGGGIFMLKVEDNTKDAIIMNLTLPSPLENTNEVVNAQCTEGNLEDWGLQLHLSRSNYLETSYRAIVNAMTVDTEVTTSNTMVNELLSTTGMSGMLGTIWLILCAMSFGGVLERLGMLQKITEIIVRKAQKQGSLILSTALTCIGFNITASDQYLSIVVPGRMYSNVFKERGLAPENLSRTLEDSGTVTSVLVPWNTCGAAQSSVLGVATGEYFMYCFFNIISPVMTIAYGYLNIKIARLKK